MHQKKDEEFNRMLGAISSTFSMSQVNVTDELGSIVLDTGDIWILGTSYTRIEVVLLFEFPKLSSARQVNDPIE